jgi:hypothetical protein
VLKDEIAECYLCEKERCHLEQTAVAKLNSPDTQILFYLCK